MKRALLALLACITIVALAQEAGNPFEGTWRSGNFAFTFNADGSYVYVGSMGNQNMNSHISEQGTYRISGNQLLVTRSSGVVWTSANYRRDLPVETIVYQWQFGTVQGRAALGLVFPNARQPQVFFKE
jgi:hypothetical protein